MTPTKQCEDLRRESERLIESGFAINALRAGFDKLTYEQKWDLENAEYFDPATLSEIQGEVQ